MAAQTGQTPPKPTATARPADEDLALVERVRAGDGEAFGQLVRKYERRVYNLMRRMVNRPADAEELAQEAFLRALERIDQFRGHSKFYTWLFRVAANLALSHRRRAGLIKFHSISSPRPDGEESSDRLAETDRPGHAVTAPDEAAMTEEVRRRVREAIDRLDEEFRVLVVLRDMEDLDYATIADVLDVPVGTVKSKLHRARSQLKGMLGDLV
jgi:RNA polymerase sigma-70 factor (ECF subfamily)